MPAMSEEWASLWYQSLTPNIDYSIYCGSRDSVTGQLRGTLISLLSTPYQHHLSHAFKQ